MIKFNFFRFKSAVITLAIAGASITAAAQPTPPSAPAGGSDPEMGVIEAILLKEVVRIVEGNISAADRENGEIDKLIRALSGVSVKDIRENGVCGGSNSEVRKLLGSVCQKIK